MISVDRFLTSKLWSCRFYCGFEDAIEVFDVHREGNNEGTRLHTTPSKKAKDGLKGQINLDSQISLPFHHSTIRTQGSYLPSRSARTKRTNTSQLGL